ncbi:hypothetical protein AAMO2058_000893700 [Amorphochlora amoebiformis]
MFHYFHYGEPKTTQRLVMDLKKYHVKHKAFPFVESRHARHLHLHVFYTKLWQDNLTEEERSILESVPGWKW